MGRNGQDGKAKRKWMEGRYGADQLSRFLSIASCAAILAGLLTRSVGKGYLCAFLVWLAIVMLVWCYWRAFSRQTERRRAENQKYLNKKAAVLGWFRFQRDKFQQRKEYAFFRCPGCKNVVRVPQGKGQLRITCRRCGYTFEKKT